LLLPQMPAPLIVVYAPSPTRRLDQVSFEVAATGCCRDDCGIFSIKALVSSITPGAGSVGSPPDTGAGTVQSRLEPLPQGLLRELYQTSSEPVLKNAGENGQST
jgi:hypothetical protein